MSTRSEVADRRVYEPLDWVAVRAPLLATDRYPSSSPGGNADDLGELARRALDDPRVRTALAAASPDLLAALESDSTLDPSDRLARRRAVRLRRYLIRMSTRPTPFGHLAGVGVAPIGATTTLALTSETPLARGRVDMAAVHEIVDRLERRPEILRQTSLLPHQGVLVRDGHAVLRDPPVRDGATAEAVTVRATPPVRAALAPRRTPAPYAAIHAAVMDSSPAATEDRAAQLIAQLCQLGFLLTDLRPVLTTNIDPCRALADRLAAMPDAASEHAELRALIAAAEAAATGDPATSPANGDVPRGTPPRRRRTVQVDAALPVRGTLGAGVADAVARAAETALRLTARPAGHPEMVEYRRRFRERFGPDVQVPLLQLLDPDIGLGLPDAPDQTDPPDRGGQAPEPDRDGILLDLATTALAEGRRVVELDESLLDRIGAAPADLPGAPASLDVRAAIAAPSREAIDRGNFVVVLDGSAGFPDAGRSLARLCHAIGPAAERAVEQAARASTEREPDRLAVTLVSAPPVARAANIAVRPVVGDRELAIGVPPGVPGERTVPLSDLTVVLRDGRLAVHWPAEGRDLAIRAGDLLADAFLCPTARAVLRIAHDRDAALMPFDWGPADALEFLPRLQVGSAVIRRARWRLRATAVDGPAALSAWRARFDGVRHVVVGSRDERLLLDLDDPAHAEELLAAIAAAGPEGATVHEALPGLDDAWLPGPDGRRLVELTVPLVRVRSRPAGPSDDHRRTRNAQPRRVDLEPAPVPVRVRPPGREWLFFKLYTQSRVIDELISGPIRERAADALARGLCDDWFFMRYRDPDHHVRLRFRGEAPRLATELLPELLEWSANLLEAGHLERVAVDTYVREVERYGGPAGVALAERLFGHDSRFIASVLAVARRTGVDRTDLGALTTSSLLSALGLDRGERVAWLVAHCGDPDSYLAVPPDRAGEAWRKRKDGLRALLEEGAEALPGTAAGEVQAALEARAAALRPLGQELRDLDRQGVLEVPLGLWLRSVVHLHLNRLFGPRRAVERQSLALLWRAEESLLRSAGRRA